MAATRGSSSSFPSLLTPYLSLSSFCLFRYSLSAIFFYSASSTTPSQSSLSRSLTRSALPFSLYISPSVLFSLPLLFIFLSLFLPLPHFPLAVLNPLFINFIFLVSASPAFLPHSLSLLLPLPPSLLPSPSPPLPISSHLLTSLPPSLPISSHLTSLLPSRFLYSLVGLVGVLRWACW